MKRASSLMIIDPLHIPSIKIEIMTTVIKVIRKGARDRGAGLIDKRKGTSGTTVAEESTPLIKTVRRRTKGIDLLHLQTILHPHLNLDLSLHVISIVTDILRNQVVRGITTIHTEELTRQNLPRDKLKIQSFH
jgi:hypothetical protein